MTHAKFPNDRGVWTDWVIYRERSWKNDGVLSIWKNRVKVVNFVGSTAINYVAHGDGGNIKFKNGIYWGTQPRDVKYTLLFDNIRTSDVANGFDLVSPGSTETVSAPPQPPSWM
ncbi:hypothetical protein [Thiogranum longum]|uniref:hypothetical protein n=1 Tax=Thiogranum longum TaxID=1537524 RepID=UPI0010441AD5|nr:hypothetical protein [Thiogranum longum]